ncbi:MAG: hypothetical protein JOZ65_07400 [Chloroflexi bacterium]|nr:hypothetical protein [Chloroflexota bacterium]
MEIRPYSTPQPPTGLTAFAAGEPLSGLHLELRLSRTTFVAGALIQTQVVVRNTNSADATVDVGVSALPQTAPADPRSFPIVFPGPGFGRPPVTVAPGQSQTISSFVQLPFDADQPVHVHASVRLGTVITVADVPVKLTPAGPAQQLHIDVMADQQQWCARATDANGRTPTETLLTSMTARSANGYMQGPISSDTATGEWAGRFPSVNPVPSDSLTLDVFAGGEDYETARAETSVSRN